MPREKAGTIPKWLKLLPDGSYTLDDIVKFTKGKNKSTIFKALKRLNIAKIYSEKPIYNNMVEIRYIWKINNIKI